MCYYMLLSIFDICSLVAGNTVKNVIWVKTSCIDSVYHYMNEHDYDFIIPYGNRKPRKVDPEQIIELA